MRKSAFTIVAAFIAWTAPLVCQTTWYVDASSLPGGDGSAAAPFTSVQSGVDAAVAGDTVLVAPGTYVGSVTIAKDITVRSVQGPEATVLGYVNQASAMTIMSTTAACLVEGVTLAHCHGVDAGCGVPATPGGLHIKNAAPTVRGCIIRNNWGGFGTLCPGYSELSQAGGVSVEGSSLPVLENCVVAGNTAAHGFAWFNAPLLWVSQGGTGGVNALYSSAVLRHCTITGNFGGAAGLTAGVIAAPAGRGGVEGVPSTTLIDCIVWGNVPGSGFSPSHHPEVGGTYSGNDPIASWCDIAGGYPGAGNIDADPVFVSPGSDFRLSTGSPCVDRGTPAGVLADIDRVARPQYFQVDVGAYEWRPPLALALAIAQPGGASSVSVSTSGGAAGDVYVNLFTTDPGNGGPSAGTGPWGGLIMSFDEAAFQLSLGVPPFVGVIDASGIATTSIPLPPGLGGVVVYAISHTVGSTLVTRRSAVVPYTFL